MFFKKKAAKVLGKVFFGGGGDSGDGFDAAYNARMANIAEQQQGMASKYFDFWESEYKPMEQAQIASNMETMPGETELNIAKNEASLSLLPGQTALTAEQIEANRSLIPGQTTLAGMQIEDSMTAMGEREPVRAEFYNQSLNGVDVESRVNKAAADASHAFMSSDNIMRRNASRMGINPNSGKFASMSNTNSINRAKTIAGAKTTARTNAEQENFGRLQTAMGYGG